ncbi:hypothetical protein [Pseudomonas sp. N040]|uniref:hypothetical protein n=1 Tax=Pseudomonas sp. N040 TaxID=2785325 RepID=UPI0018A25F0A|nr:hypothetical protein [Pseudomonas sp. N040]MBF7729290.1 hypothetical protein [Pseudomonas sp. N040]MBW7012930.1 hypothetical protein [Pseudomonas sp. N040]
MLIRHSRPRQAPTGQYNPLIFSQLAVQASQIGVPEYALMKESTLIAASRTRPIVPKFRGKQLAGNVTGLAVTLAVPAGDARHSVKL